MFAVSHHFYVQANARFRRRRKMKTAKCKLLHVIKLKEKDKNRTGKRSATTFWRVNGRQETKTNVFYRSRPQPEPRVGGSLHANKPALKSQPAVRLQTRKIAHQIPPIEGPARQFVTGKTSLRNASDIGLRTCEKQSFPEPSTALNIADKRRHVFSPKPNYNDQDGNTVGQVDGACAERSYSPATAGCRLAFPAGAVWCNLFDNVTEWYRSFVEYIPY